MSLPDYLTKTESLCQQNIMNAAITYTEEGWEVFLLKAGTRKSRLSEKAGNGKKWGKTTDPDYLKLLFAEFPDDNLGIATGKTSGIFVIDIDTLEGHGVDGFASLALLEQKHGSLPETLQSESPSGSRHYFFNYPDFEMKNTTSELAPGIDVRGEGGMVIATPSITKRGTYRWITSGPVVDAPGWLLDLLRPRQQHQHERKSNGNGAWNGSNTPYAQAALDRECEKVSKSPKSKRNHTLNNAALALGQLIAGGELDQTDVDTRLFQAAVACGLDKDEGGASGVWATIKSGITAGMKEPRSTPHTDEYTTEKNKKPNSIKTIRASHVKQEPITWIWDKRLAQGKITILSGDPGLCKSQIGIDIVARITRGSKWCDGGMAPLGNCIILSAEDAANDTICPRLEVAGANLDRVEIIESVVTKDGDRSFSLAHDLGALAETVQRIGNVSLIVIDPVTAYLGDKIDSHQTTAVRAVLEPLSRFAEQARVTILAITHPPKATQSKAMHAFTGSLAFVAAARIALVAVDEPDTERKLLLGVKTNNERLPDGLGYRPVQATTSKGITSCRVLWDDQPVDITADEALHARGHDESKIKKAEQFLTTYLKGGPAPQQEILAQGKALGLSSRTLQRAKSNLDISSDKTDFESGWTWTLPRYDEGCQNAVPPRRQPLFGRKDAK